MMVCMERLGDLYTLLLLGAFIAITLIFTQMQATQSYLASQGKNHKGYHSQSRRIQIKLISARHSEATEGINSTSAKFD